MTGLCGWLCSPTDDSLTQSVLEAMIKGLYPTATDIPQAYTPQAACAAPGGSLSSLSDGLTAIIAGHPHWSTTGLARFAAERGHARTLIEAYRRYGTGLFQYLYGAFALVVLDPTSQRLIAAVDRMGQQPLYYGMTAGGGLVFGSTAGSVRVHPYVDNPLSNQGIFNYVYFHMVPSPGCIYEGQHKLLAGHYLDYRAGQIETVSYWQPDFTEPAEMACKASGKDMQALILEAVRRLSEGKSVGAFLSGGLDSSTVAGMLAQIRPGEAKTYSIGFAVDGYDEMGYARIAARHFRTQPSEYYVTPQDVAAIVPTIASSYDEPFGNSSAVPAYYCAKLAAEDGITRMLAGDGGDELFAGNERYARQQVFEYYQRLPVILRKRLFEPALLHLPGQPSLIHKVQSYIRQANVPLPDRLQTYNFLQRHAYEDVFASDFLDTVDLEKPLYLQREHYHRPAAASVLNRMMYLDWHQTLADNDLRKVNRMCTLAGVEVVYPLLDDAVVGFSCRIPSYLKLKGQRLRYFYKQAMRDFLPKEIIAKSKHGFGLPFGIWMRSHRPLQELAYDSLLQLKRRHYFQATFIDKAIELHRSNHAAYYGELVWVLMMLELWLDQHST